MLLLLVWSVVAWVPVQVSRLPALLGTPGFDSSTYSALYCVLELHLCSFLYYVYKVSVSQPLRRSTEQLCWLELTKVEHHAGPPDCASHSRFCPRLFSRQDSRVGTVSSSSARSSFCCRVWYLHQPAPMARHSRAPCRTVSGGRSSRCGGGSAGGRLASYRCS